tara:strand:+ start:2889 stop:3635 length:747 start_codon:yes stop_codon:yes gene_type:complete
MDIKERILVALGLEKPEQEITLAFQAKSDDGTIFVSTAEELKDGVDVAVLTEDGTTIPLPKGTYSTAEGLTFRVEEEGVVSEVMEKKEKKDEDEDEDKKEEKEEMKKKKKDDEDEEEMREEKDEEEEEKKMRKKDEENKYESEEMPDWYKKTYEEMKDKVDNLMDAIADLKSKMGVKEEDVKMKEELSSQEEVIKLKEENEKLKVELKQSPADAPINTNRFSSERTPLSRKEYKKLSKQERFLYNLGK